MKFGKKLTDAADIFNQFTTKYRFSDALINYKQLKKVIGKIKAASENLSRFAAAAASASAGNATEGLLE